MKKATERLLKKAGEMIKKQAVGTKDWPPYCIGFFYQPKRPEGISKRKK